MTLPISGRARAAFLALFVLLLAAYTLLDLREGGRASSLLTTRLADPGFYISRFGGWFFWGGVALNLVLAAVTAALVVLSLAPRRPGGAAPGTGTGAACTAGGTLLLGFAVFGCPGCVMPLFGTLGVAVFATALPLFGLELKLLSIVVTLAALAWVLRRHGPAAIPRQPSPAAGYGVSR